VRRCATLSICMYLTVRSTSHRNALLRFHCKSGYANAPQYYVHCLSCYVVTSTASRSGRFVLFFVTLFIPRGIPKLLACVFVFRIGGWMSLVACGHWGQETKTVVTLLAKERHVRCRAFGKYFDILVPVVAERYPRCQS